MDIINSNNQTNLFIKRQVQIEAISRAVYLVTELFDSEEPLKMSLRKISVKCIENDNEDNLLKLSSFIRLSKDIKLISDMNADILIKVIDNYLFNLSLVKKEKRGDVDLNNILETEIEEKEESLKVDKELSAVEIIPEDRIEKKTSNITINNNTQNIKTINHISMDIGSRRKRILEIVKSRGAVTINEFTEAIKGCSSKTIQRELTSLVLSGTLKKTGERRWSKYSLK